MSVITGLSYSIISHLKYLSEVRYLFIYLFIYLSTVLFIYALNCNALLYNVLSSFSRVRIANIHLVCCSFAQLKSVTNFQFPCTG